MKEQFISTMESSKGVAIAIPKARLLIIDCQIKNNPFPIFNIYSPTNDNLTAQNELLEK